MKKIFVIDNYDSFTYNLVHYLEELGTKVSVKRNDQFELASFLSFIAFMWRGAMYPSNDKWKENWPIH